MLHRVAYASTARERLAASELSLLIGATRNRNPTLGLSGVLVYSGTHFLQVLEGPATGVASVFERIQADPRHQDIAMLIDESCAARWFDDCRIGYLYGRSHADELAALHARGSPLESAEQGVLRALLSAADLW